MPVQSDYNTDYILHVLRFYGLFMVVYWDLSREAETQIKSLDYRRQHICTKIRKAQNKSCDGQVPMARRLLLGKQYICTVSIHIQVTDLILSRGMQIGGTMLDYGHAKLLVK